MAKISESHFLRPVFPGGENRDRYRRDASGEDVEVEYFIGDKMYFVGSWEGNTFAPYTGPISIDADGRYAVYVKLTNASGKITYLSSDGFVIDTTAPVIEGVEAGKVYCDEVTATIVEENIDTVTVGGEPRYP